MAVQSINSPRQIFTDIDGQPLENGYIYIGTAGLQASTNQISVYWDAAKSVPATQPIRTTGGYPMQSGAPGTIYVDVADFSMEVSNKNNSTIVNPINQTERISSDVLTYQSTLTGSSERSLASKLSDSVSVKDFGATGDGVTDDTTAIQACFEAVKSTKASVYFPSGTYQTTAPINMTLAGSGNGGDVFGDGWGSNIVYTPPVAAAGSLLKRGPFYAGALEFGNTNNNNMISDLRITLGGVAKNGSCGIYAYNAFSIKIRNCIINGFEVGLHLASSWSSVLSWNYITNCTYGIAWDDVTIGTMRGNTLGAGSIGIVFGWNIWGDNVTEPTLFTQGVTLSENTIQGYSECSILGKNTQVTTINGNYTEGNCAGPYTILNGADFANGTDFDGAELVFLSDNVYNNGFLNIQDNWLSGSLATVDTPLGIQACTNTRLSNNAFYGTRYVEARVPDEIIVGGKCGTIDVDNPAHINLVTGGNVNGHSPMATRKPCITWASTAAMTDSGAIAIPDTEVRGVIIPIDLTESTVATLLYWITGVFNFGPLDVKFGVFSPWVDDQISRGELFDITFVVTTGGAIAALPKPILLPEGTSYLYLGLSNNTGGLITINYDTSISDISKMMRWDDQTQLTKTTFSSTSIAANISTPNIQLA